MYEKNRQSYRTQNNHSEFQEIVINFESYFSNAVLNELLFLQAQYSASSVQYIKMTIVPQIWFPILNSAHPGWIT